MNKSAQDYILFLLSRRDYTVAEVEKKAKEKGYGKEEIRKSVSNLTGKKLLDDERFAKIYCETHRSWGNVKIKYGLIKKGISQEIIDKILTEDNEEEKAREAAELWLKKNKNVAFEKIYNRLAGYLSRQGFRWEIAKEVLNELKDGKIK